MDKLVGMEKFLCIWNNFNGHEILAMENFVGYVMDMWEFFCCAWTYKNFLWLLWTCMNF